MAFRHFIKHLFMRLYTLQQKKNPQPENGFWEITSEEMISVAKDSRNHNQFSLNGMAGVTIADRNGTELHVGDVLVNIRHNGRLGIFVETYDAGCDGFVLGLHVKTSEASARMDWNEGWPSKNVILYKRKDA